VRGRCCGAGARCGWADGTAVQAASNGSASNAAARSPWPRVTLTIRLQKCRPAGVKSIDRSRLGPRLRLAAPRSVAKAPSRLGLESK
jgi:hypothetical protein